MSAERFKTFEEFWPFYLREHANPVNRRLHQAGTTGALATLAYSVLRGKPAVAPLALVVGYGPAWVGHFIIEKNRPATFTYPAWSLLGDFKMNKLMWTGELDDELRRLGITFGETHASGDIAG